MNCPNDLCFGQTVNSVVAFKNRIVNFDYNLCYESGRKVGYVFAINQAANLVMN